MKQVTASELKELDPKRFASVYEKWRAYCLDHGWWDCVYEHFIGRCAALGVRVDDMTFTGFWSQGDGAAFAGRVSLAEFMKSQGLDEQYPALYLGVVDDGSYLRVGFEGNNMRCADYGMYANQTAPSGMFSNLDQLAWEELLEEQENDAALEDRVMKYCNGLANELYRDLEKEYDYLTSEEQFIASCEGNEITFETTEETA